MGLLSQRDLWLGGQLIENGSGQRATSPPAIPPCHVLPESGRSAYRTKVAASCSAAGPKLAENRTGVGRTGKRHRQKPLALHHTRSKPQQIFALPGKAAQGRVIAGELA